MRARARLLHSIRAFFARREVLEVQTPLLASAANTDPHIDSLAVHSALADYPHYLLSSPELPIKRLLAAGVGDCYQLGAVFRDGEAGRQHNPEFTLLEWYRLGYRLLDLLGEVEQLIQQQAGQTLEIRRYRYAQLFEEVLDIDPLCASTAQLNQRLYADSLWQPAQGELDKDAALDLLFSQRIAPQFPAQQLTGIYHYPRSQASLARLSEDDPRVAERFEVYWGSTELANGFYELCDAREQQQRFAQDNQQRVRAGKPAMPIDPHFIAALQHGLPECSGVALGIDRLLMKILDKAHIHEVLSFDWSRV